jgi:periplasmic copper chaperone A
MQRRTLCLAAGLFAATACAVQAHGSRAGDLQIDHPYALPSATGATEGSAHLRALSNRGRTADRLLGASAAVADAVELQRAGQPVASIELPPGATLALRHDSAWRLLLKGLKAPLVNGQRFALRLRFEHAGEREVTVWVQQPRAATHAH